MKSVCLIRKQNNSDVANRILARNCVYIKKTNSAQKTYHIDSNSVKERCINSLRRPIKKKRARSYSRDKNDQHIHHGFHRAFKSSSFTTSAVIFSHLFLRQKMFSTFKNENHLTYSTRLSDCSSQAQKTWLPTTYRWLSWFLRYIFQYATPNYTFCVQ